MNSLVLVLYRQYLVYAVCILLHLDILYSAFLKKKIFNTINSFQFSQMQIESTFPVSLFLPSLSKEEQCAVVSLIIAHWSLTVQENETLSCQPIPLLALQWNCIVTVLLSSLLNKPVCEPHAICCYPTGVSVEKIKWIW